MLRDAMGERPYYFIDYGESFLEDSEEESSLGGLGRGSLDSSSLLGGTSIDCQRSSTLSSLGGISIGLGVLGFERSDSLLLRFIGIFLFHVKKINSMYVTIT